MINIYHLFLKRIFDILFSAFVLLILLPLIIVIMVIIKVVSPGGSIFFAHERVGLDGEPFKCWKFRTMVPNAQQLLDDLLNAHPELAMEFANTQKIKNDPRVLPIIGAFLRRTSMDELPQFFNVLLNQMSVIGPRPITHDELIHYQPHADKFLSIKPGITGLWQTSGRNDITYNQRVRLDLYYIDNFNILLDLKIVFKTFITIIRGSGY